MKLNIKLIFTFALLVLFHLKGKAQIADSNNNSLMILKSELSNSLSDSAKAKILWSIAGYYLQENNVVDSQLYYALKWYDFVKDKNSIDYDASYGEINSSMSLSTVYEKLGLYSKGIKIQLCSLIKVENHNRGQYVNSLSALSELYLESEDYVNSIKYANKVLELVSNNPVFKSNDSSASKFDLFFYPGALMILGEAYLESNNLDSALYYINKNLEISSKYPEARTLANAEKDLGLYYLKKGELDLALVYFKKSAIHPDVEYDIQFEFSRLMGLANTYFRLGKFDSSIHYSKIAYLKSKNEKYSKGLLNSSFLLGKSYQVVNKVDSALIYMNEFVKIKDSLFNNKLNSEIVIQTFEESKRQEQIEDQKKEEQAKRGENIKLGLIAVFIPVFASIVFLLGKKKKKHTKIISLMGLASTLMLFEFISLLIHPYIEAITNHDTMFIYLILLIIAAILVPLHHKLEEWVKSKI